MSDLPIKEFEIGDHKYTVIPHKTREATRLVMDIYGALSGPGLQLIVSLAEARDELSLDSDVSEALELIDSEKLGTQIKSALTQLHEDQVRELFSKTTRGDKDLSNDGIYDDVYAGNWGEWTQAIYEIVRANGFLSFLSTMIGSDDKAKTENQ